MNITTYLRSVRSVLSDDGRQLFDQAFKGDALAARRLMFVAPLRLRGHIACLAYQRNVPNPAYREILQAVWKPESRHLLADFWPKPMLRRMFVRGDFAIPPLASPVTMFRQAAGVSARKAATGLLWTLSFQVAMQKATYVSASDPRVVQATIDPKAIIYWDNDRGEQEVIARHTVRSFNLCSIRPKSGELRLVAHGGR